MKLEDKINFLEKENEVEVHLLEKVQRKSDSLKDLLSVSEAVKNVQKIVVSDTQKQSMITTTSRPLKKQFNNTERKTVVWL